MCTWFLPSSKDNSVIDQLELELQVEFENEVDSLQYRRTVT